MLKKSLIFLLVVLLVATTFLVGCNKNNNQPANNNTNNGGETTTPPETVDNNPAKSRGNQLVIGDTTLDGKFNPLFAGTVYDVWIVNLIFEGLLSGEVDGSLGTNAIAERYEFNEADKSYTFYLKKGVKYHNGEETVAEDFAFGYVQYARPEYEEFGGGDAYLFESIVGFDEFKAGERDYIDGITLYTPKPENPLPVAYVETENDPYKFTVKVDEIQAITLRYVAGGITPLERGYYDKSTYQDFVMLNLAPMGNGPFVFNRYVVDQFVELDAFKDFYKGTPKVEKVIYRCFADNSVQLPELEAGTVDAVAFESTEENYQTASNIPFAYIIEYINNGYAYIGFNFRVKKLQDKRVRQALTYGLNRQEFVDSFFNGRGAVAVSPISPVSWAFPEGLDEYQYNPEKAAQLLDEAGWKLESDGWRYKDGEKFTINWTTYSGAAWVDRILPIAQENWKALGIEMIPNVMEFNAVIEKLNAMGTDFDLWNMAWGLGADPDMSGIYSKEQDYPGGSNRGSYYNEDVERLMQEGKRELDPEKRKEIYQEIARLMNDDCPYIYVYIRNNYWAVNKRVKNFKPSPFQYWTVDAHLIEVEY